MTISQVKAFVNFLWDFQVNKEVSYKDTSKTGGSIKYI